ncbi:MAG: hypothetical protein RL423_469, partial [Bacteroidota bacterium]
MYIKGLGILSDKLTHKNILTKFAVQIKCMEPNLLIDKTQNEARQGEAYASQANPGVFEKHFYVESYGCAMNFADSEVVAAILEKNGFGGTKNIEIADLILINTCSIREKAELTIRKRLTEFRRLKQANPGVLVGVLGCMAERLKAQLLEEEKLVD